MARTPTTTTLLRNLEDIVKRMDAVETLLKELDHDVEELKGWHRETEYAKKILREYQEQHPEISPATTINGKAWAAVLAALTALTAILLASLT